MKILSVCIHPHEPARLRGSVRLSLADLSADPTDPVDLQQGRVIGNGPVRGLPCVSVALRRFTISVADVSRGAFNDVDLNLDHAFEPADSDAPTHLRVSWDINHRIHEGSTIYLRQEGIREISVLIIGEL